MEVSYQNEPKISVSTKGGQFFDNLNGRQILKDDLLRGVKLSIFHMWKLIPPTA